jgi:hypothetical protein
MSCTRRASQWRHVQALGASATESSAAPAATRRGTSQPCRCSSRLHPLGLLRGWASRTTQPAAPMRGGGNTHGRMAGRWRRKRVYPPVLPMPPQISGGASQLAGHRLLRDSGRRFRSAQSLRATRDAVVRGRCQRHTPARASVDQEQRCEVDLHHGHDHQVPSQWRQPRRGGKRVRAGRRRRKVPVS